MVHKEKQVNINSTLKELRNCISRIICVIIILFNAGLYKSTFFPEIFLLFCLSGLPALCQIRCNFHKLCNICLIVVYIVGVRYSVFLLSIMSKKRYYTINIWVHFLINKHVSMELLRFSILQIPFIKKNVKHSQTVWVKKAINKQIVLRTCKKYKLYFGPLVLAAL